VKLPHGWTPERLFRLLLRTPRPALPIAHRVSGAEHIPLDVRALRPLEEAQLLDAVAAVTPVEAQPGAFLAHMVAAALWTPSGRAFPGPGAVGELLYGDEAEEIGSAVLAAIDIVSPSYRRGDAEAWRKLLLEGARHHTNITTTIALGGCVEVGWRVSVRPDWFFGMPLGEITDGHWMAFRAAREIVAEMEKKNG
jgi:hypothetical protein